MKLNRIYSLSLSALALISLWSCGSSSNDGNGSQEFEEAQQSLSEEIEDVVYNIPSPSEIPYLLQATGAEFNQSLVNAPQKATQYSTRNDEAALNLGVYAADIGYLSSYDKTQDAIEYMNAAKGLADNLGIIASFDMQILEQFEANISNKDSLASLLDDAIKQTENYLKDDSRNRLAALMLTGSFVEGLYISTQLVKSYPKDLLPDDARNLVLTPMMRIILEQEKSVGELLRMLRAVDQNEPVPGIVAELTSLQSSYMELNIEEQIRNDNANVVLTDQTLAEITDIVDKLRTSIVD